MKILEIDKKAWESGMAELHRQYRLIGPVRKDAYHGFESLGPDQLPDMDFPNTRLSTKGLVFPQSEKMLEFSTDERREDHHIMKEIPFDDQPRAVIGMRPCDAKATTLVKLNFDNPDYPDTYWNRLHQATTYVGLACDNPCVSCFCTTADCGPYHESGLDILLADTGDTFLAKILTDRGDALATAAGWKTSVLKADELETRRQAAEEKITAQIETEYLASADLLELHSADFWEEVSFACINCGTCTFVCPTCWCFDIQDETFGTQGKRMRNWDSCMFPIFTVHTTGHNPRDTKMQRVRQRFMHKLKYFVDKYDQGIMCVGCGRCVRQCPVNIDIRKVGALMNKVGSKSACAV